MSIVKVAQWKIDGEIGTFTIEHPTRYHWKRAVRIKAGDTGEFAGTSAVNYGTSDEFSVGISLRLEDVYGGHATTRIVAQQFSSGKGWKITYNVANAQLDFYVDDGAGNSATISVDIDEKDLVWWFMYFEPGRAGDGLQVYKHDQLQSVADTTSIANIHSSSSIFIGDATNTVAMMFGGFFMTSDELLQADIDAIIVASDDVWNPTIDNIQIHTPGLNHDWGGGISRDIDEGASQWKDVTGNTFHLNFTLADSTNSMARETARKTHVLYGQLETLTFSRHGSVATIMVSEDDTVDVGDVLVLKTPYNQWSGNVEEKKKDIGGNRLKVTGIDEDGAIPFRNDVFASRTAYQNDLTEDETNMIVESTDGGAVAGSGYLRLNPKAALTNDALRHGVGSGHGVLSSFFLADTPVVFGITDFSLMGRTKSKKDAASEVTVYGYGNADIPKNETFSGPLDDLTLADRPVEIVKVEDATDGILYSGYRVDADNKIIYFDATTTDDIEVDYLIRDVDSATAQDLDVEESIGVNQRLWVWVGYITSTPLQTIADALIRDKYWIVTGKPNGKKFFKKRWYVGMKITISQTGDPFGINGDYFISKVTYSTHLLTTPVLELEEYDTTIGFPSKPPPRDMNDLIGQKLEDDQFGYRGFH